MKKRQGGFTLIELMFTIVVLAVLLGIGIPNFRAFILNGHMTAAANDLLSDVNLARSESVKRRVPVLVCATSGGSSPSCATSGSQFSAWLVYVDANSNGSLDAGEITLRQHDRVNDNVTGTATGGLLITFRPSGYPASGSTSQVIFCDDRKNDVTAGGLPAARAVVIVASGRPMVTRPTSGCP
jgi:type IV fimbrial biogenesis protein FimT